MRKKGFTIQLDAETGRGYGRQQQMIVSYTMEGDKGLRNAECRASLDTLFLTEPKTGRTRYPTCTNTILGPSLLKGQPVRQMVHGNDSLHTIAHSNRQAALL